MVLSTERLIVRPWTPDDADRHFDIYSRDEVSRWLGSGRSLGAPEESLPSIERWTSTEDPRLGVWALEVRETGVVAGSVLLVTIPRTGQGSGLPPEDGGEVEIGWHLHPDSWGQGYATEAARAVLEHGFAAGFEEILAVTNLDNFRSQAVCRRLGMEHRGRTDRYYGHELELYASTKGAWPFYEGG